MQYPQSPLHYDVRIKRVMSVFKEPVWHGWLRLVDCLILWIFIFVRPAKVTYNSYYYSRYIVGEKNR